MKGRISHTESMFRRGSNGPQRLFNVRSGKKEVRLSKIYNKGKHIMYRVHFEGEAVIDHTLVEGGMPLSMKPIPNNLKLNLDNFAPLASQNLSRMQSVRIMFPIWRSSSYAEFLICST